MSEDYNRDAPTPQNVLCSGRSWLEVIEASLQNHPTSSLNLTEAENGPGDGAATNSSSWESVANRSEESAANRTGEMAANRPEEFSAVAWRRPEFFIRRWAGRRYILVLERAGRMAVAHRWLNLHNALHR